MQTPSGMYEVHCRFSRATRASCGRAALQCLAAALTIPIIILFFIAQRTFIQAITLTGIKG